jgi:hypothetical protein
MPPTPGKTTGKGGTEKLTRSDVLQASQAPFERFSQLRYSVRQFSPQDVDLETIRGAVRVAQKTPSVCNRQQSLGGRGRRKSTVPTSRRRTRFEPGKSCSSSH